MIPQVLSTSRNKIGKKIIRLDSVDSTNVLVLSNSDYLKTDGLVVSARCQLKGKGRQQKQWISSNNDNLYCSLVVHPEFPARLYPAMTLFTGLAVYRSLNRYQLNGLSVKWPNDILVNGKKICGILCELKQLDDGQHVIVVGVGINLCGNSRDFPVELKDQTTTLEQETGYRYIAEEVLGKFLDELEKIWLDVCSGIEVDLFKEWETVSSSLGKRIEYEEGQDKKHGVILGLSSLGYLKVRNEHGLIKEVLAGEIKFV